MCAVCMSQRVHQRVSPVFRLRLKYDLCDLYKSPAVLLCTEYMFSFSTIILSLLGMDIRIPQRTLR